jgi:hypothetical protein
VQVYILVFCFGVVFWGHLFFICVDFGVELFPIIFHCLYVGIVQICAMSSASCLSVVHSLILQTEFSWCNTSMLFIIIVFYCMD